MLFNNSHIVEDLVPRVGKEKIEFKFTDCESMVVLSTRLNPFEEFKIISNYLLGLSKRADFEKFNSFNVVLGIDGGVYMCVDPKPGYFIFS